MMMVLRSLWPSLRPFGLPLWPGFQGCHEILRVAPPLPGDLLGAVCAGHTRSQHSMPRMRRGPTELLPLVNLLHRDAGEALFAELVVVPEALPAPCRT